MHPPLDPRSFADADENGMKFEAWQQNVRQA